MAKIKIDSAKLQQNEQAINKKIQELTELNHRLKALIIRIQDSWEGDASKAYVSMMQNYVRQAEKMIKVLQELKSYVNSAIHKFEQTDKSSASKLRGSF